MTFTKLLAILNEKHHLYEVGRGPLYEVGNDTSAKVFFGDNGGYIDWDGIRFGFTFGSDDAEWYDCTGDVPSWSKIPDEAFLEQLLKKEA